MIVFRHESMHNASMGSEAVVTVRMPAMLKRRLAARAERQHCSLSAQIVADLEGVLGVGASGSGAAARPRPVLGMYEPDSIAAARVKGKDWLFLANEGDTRVWGAFNEEVRVKDIPLTSLDPVAFPNAAMLRQDVARARHVLGARRTCDRFAVGAGRLPSVGGAAQPAVREQERRRAGPRPDARGQGLPLDRRAQDRRLPGVPGRLRGRGGVPPQHGGWQPIDVGEG